MFSFIFFYFLNGGGFMLDQFLATQFIASTLLKNSIQNGKLSHAYLIDVNDCEDADDFVMAFVCSIFCDNHYTNQKSSECKSCNLCNRLKNHNYPELKVIETDSLIIKKEQLLELQTEFSRSSIEGNYRVYIIKDCDKMNKQASNCLLKFLEEPVPGIVAILVTNHFSKVLSTIVSRCQLIRLNHVYSFEKTSAFENFALLCSKNKASMEFILEDESKKELFDTALAFIDYFEENKLDVLIFMKNMWYNKISSREDSILAFLLIIYFYYDILKYKIGYEQYFYCDCLEIVKKIANKNSISEIIKKLDIIIYGYEMLKCNLNVNLLMDDIVIQLNDVEE